MLASGGTLAAMARAGSPVYLLRVTDDGDAGESERAAQILGVKRVFSLGYRPSDLAAVSPTELRDRILFYIRHLQPRALVIPNPYTHHDSRLDRYYAGSAAEEARLAAGLPNFQPPFAVVGLKPFTVPELYYYAPPVDAATLQPEGPPAFVPQPVSFDIQATFDRKQDALIALKSYNQAVAEDVTRRLARTGRKMENSADALAKIRVDGLGRSEAFLRTGGALQGQ